MSAYGGDVPAEDDDDRFHALLDATHRFPGRYLLSVITMTDDEAFAALRAALMGEGFAVPEADDWTTRQSSGGRYTSHRIMLQCRSTADVLLLYRIVRGVPGVVTVM